MDTDKRPAWAPTKAQLHQFIEYAQEAIDNDLCTIDRLQDLVDDYLVDDEGEPLDDPEPECGHSACRQWWIDTGRGECVSPTEEG